MASNGRVPHVRSERPGEHPSPSQRGYYYRPRGKSWLRVISHATWRRTGRVAKEVGGRWGTSGGVGTRPDSNNSSAMNNDMGEERCSDEILAFCRHRQTVFGLFNNGDQQGSLRGAGRQRDRTERKDKKKKKRRQFDKQLFDTITLRETFLK